MGLSPSEMRKFSFGRSLLKGQGHAILEVMKCRSKANSAQHAPAAHADATTGCCGRDDVGQADGEGASTLLLKPSLSSRWLTILAASLIVLSAVAVYHNSFAGPFVYDDITSIVENPTIRRLWPIWQVLSPPCDGETVGGRPLLNISLAINYALGGLNVGGYHATNLAIHIAVALLLLGILRRTFLTPALRDRFGSAALPLALAGTLLWTVHPLQTESVTYIVQRAESLAGLFYLLTLYCVIRGVGTVPFFARSKPTSPGTLVGEKGDCPPGRRSWLWYAAALLACLLGMATKEVVITAPLTVLLYDRTFLAGSFAEAVRRRWRLYAGLAATWGLLAYLVFSTGLIARQAELGAPDWWSYACSQPRVILHYLRLSLWPNRLCMSYEWPVANTVGEFLPGAIVVALLLAATVWGLARRTAWGFLGAWFFLMLAPTSSIMPLNQFVHEHRMYLSLAAFVVAVVAGGYRLWQKWPAGSAASSPRAAVLRRLAPLALLAAVLAVLGHLTIARNRDYRSLVAIWQDSVDKCPHSPVGYNNLGCALIQAAKSPETIERAIAHYHAALRLKPNYVDVYNNLGLALAGLGQKTEAIKYYQQALRLKPDFTDAHNNLGVALADLGKTEEAIEHYDQVLRLKPECADAHNNLGIALAKLGKTAEAIQHYQQALSLKPEDAEARNNLGNALVAIGKVDEAMEHFYQVLRVKPHDANAHANLGAASVRAGKIEEAIQQYHEALRLKPDHAEAHNNLGYVLAGLGKMDEAIAHFNQALQRKPDYGEAHYNLGIALANLGKISQAIQQYHEALRLKPDYADAHNNLANLLAQSGKNDEAIEHFHQALRLKPNYGPIHYNLGIVLAAVGKTDEAIRHFNQMVQLMPDSLLALNSLAWLLATRDPAEGGDPGRAVQLAQRARELAGRENAQCLDTLAAAYAAAGRFDDAIPTAQQAVQLAESTGQTALAKNIQSRLDLYRAGRAYREALRLPEKKLP